MNNSKSFSSDQEVRWCPGCGDYAILKAVQNVLADIDETPENTVFVSGIGCSSRFPYYMNTYGFHTIHGRGLAVASGMKLANPDLNIWCITGDGDSLSIGGNHLIHTLRKNFDLNILLFNNEIYGLTKGQYSPASKPGIRTPTSPGGSNEKPVAAGLLALGAGATFYGRGIDTKIKNLEDTLKRGKAHKGASLIEIFQNCIVYNDAAFSHFTDKSNRDLKQLWLKEGEPMLFGKDQEFGISLCPKTFTLKVVNLIENPELKESVLLHDSSNFILAQMLLKMPIEDYPIALGVIYKKEEPSFEEHFHRS